MKAKVTLTVLAMLIAASVLAVGISAVAQEATKTGIGYSGTQVVAGDAKDWTTILSGWMKTGTPKDMAVSFTAESMLGTYVYVQTTKTSTGGLAVDSDSASAAVQVRCLVDGKVAYPGAVTFDNRLMRLSALLGEGVISDPTTGLVTYATDQWISIYECTKQSHAFNFFYENLGSGDHLIEMQAKIVLNPSLKTSVLDPNPGTTDAYLGCRTMICDEVNLKSRVYPK